jgi:ABC-2 type transport system ATP-binding protein
MNSPSIAVIDVHKRFGPTVALDGMDFAVQGGRVTGFVGPNGAGKSTTIRVVLGLDAPDAGRALIAGRPYAGLHRPLTHVGALLDAGALQPGRSGYHHLLWLARSQGLPTRRVGEVLDLVGLGSAARRKAGGYSLGMRQRLGIAAALLGDPAVVIMDEPFNGMDPEGIIWMRQLLRGLADEGRAVLVSSHLMGELQGMADHVVIVGRGRVLADASLGELLAGEADGRIRVRTPLPGAALAALRHAGAAAVHLEPETRPGAGADGNDRPAPGVVVVSGLAAEAVVEALTKARVAFSEITAERTSLEDVYLRLTGGQAEYRAAPGQVRS